MPRYFKGPKNLRELLEVFNLSANTEHMNYVGMMTIQTIVLPASSHISHSRADAFGFLVNIIFHSLISIPAHPCTKDSVTVDYTSKSKASH